MVTMSRAGGSQKNERYFFWWFQLMRTSRAAESMSGVPPYRKEIFFFRVYEERMGETDFTVRRRPVLSASIVKTSSVKDRSYIRSLSIFRSASVQDSPRPVTILRWDCEQGQEEDAHYLRRFCRSSLTTLRRSTDDSFWPWTLPSSSNVIPGEATIRRPHLS